MREGFCLLLFGRGYENGMKKIPSTHCFFKKIEKTLDFNPR